MDCDLHSELSLLGEGLTKLFKKKRNTLLNQLPFTLIFFLFLSTVKHLSMTSRWITALRAQMCSQNVRLMPQAATTEKLDSCEGTFQTADDAIENKVKKVKG